LKSGSAASLALRRALSDAVFSASAISIGAILEGLGIGDELQFPFGAGALLRRHHRLRVRTSLASHLEFLA